MIIYVEKIARLALVLWGETTGAERSQFLFLYKCNINILQIWNKDSIQIRNSEVCSGARPQELSARSFYISRVKGHPAITTPLQMISAKTAFETEIFHEYDTNIEKIKQIS